MRITARNFSIRRLAPLTSGAYTLVALFVAAAFVWSSRVAERAIDTVTRDTQTHMIASELERRVLVYQRLSNIYVLTRDAEAARTTTDLGAQIRDLLTRADAAEGAEERALVERVSRDVSAFLEQRERLDHGGLRLSEVLRHTQPTLNDALDSLDALRDRYRRRAEDAYTAARRQHDWMQGIALLAATVLLLWLIALVVGSRRLVLAPLLALHDTMRCFRTGETAVRAPRAGMLEVAQLAEGFNELADTLSRQREDQLTFLASVAHDLRNPLNALKLGLQVLERERSEAGRSTQSSRLARQVERLSRLVEDLLDATRIEAGQLELREQLFDLADVVRDIVALYGPTSPQHDIHTDLPPDPIVVFGDPVRFEQVVSNLLSNAIKFSPHGGRLDVRGRAVDNEAVLEVADQGIGISEDEISVIFLPFRRRKPDVAPGAGLGLSVVRHIVNAHRGRIEVESKPGEGTTVRVRVPVRQAAIPIAATP